MNTLIKYLSILLFLTAFAGVSQEKMDKDDFTYKKVRVKEKSQSTLNLKGAINSATNSTSSELKTANDGEGETLADLSVTPTGAAQYVIPLALPPGINGVAPEVSLTYNSQNGNGQAGYGWNISGVSQITRLPATRFHDNQIDGVDFDKEDRFALDGKRLILKNGTHGADAEYETEIFSNLKITSHGNSPYAAIGPKYFLIHYPDGSVAKYGGDVNSRTELVYVIKYWENAQRIRINYTYLKENNTLTISKISYGRIASGGGINEINFLYQHTPNRAEQAYVKGSRFVRSKNLSNIIVESNGERFRSYNIYYENTSLGYSRVKSIKESSSISGVSKKPIVFKYNNTAQTITVNNQTTGLSVGSINQLNAETVSLDFTGNGRMDFIVYPKNNKNKFWLFKDPQNGTTNYHYEANTGRFETLFASNLLSHNNKILPGQGLTVVQNSGTNSVNFKSYANSLTTPMVYQYNKSWSVPTFNYDYTLDYSEQKRIDQKYISGDFNGDGLTDVLALGKSYRKRTCRPTTGNCNDPQELLQEEGESDEHFVSRKQHKKERLLNGKPPSDCYTCNTYLVNNRSVHFINLKRNITSNFSNFAGNLQQQIGPNDRVLTGDFNGDGKTDIMHVTASKLLIYSLNNNNKLELLWTHNNGVLPDTPVLLGDYNGDGKTDFLSPIQAETNNFNRFISTGINFERSFFVAPFEYKKPENPHDNVIYAYNLVPIDVNGDGRTDIIEHNTLSNQSEGLQEIKIYNNMGLRLYNNTLRLRFQQGGYVSKIGNIQNFPIPIFLTSNDPNKSLSFGTISDKWITSFSFNKDHKEDILIRSIKSNGVEQVINYGNLDSSISNNGLYLYQNTSDDNYPYANITSASGTKLVSSIQRVSQGSTTLKQEFGYYDAVYNVEGLGFIGFKGRAESNWHTGVSDRIFNIFKYNTLQRGALTEQYSIKNYYSFFVPNSGYISKTVNQNSFTLSNNKVFKLRNDSSLTQNSIDGTYTNVVYQYDDYNNPKKITTNYSGQGTHTLDITYENNLGSNYYIGRPIKQIETKTIGSETFKTTKELTYNRYLLTKKKTFGNGTFPDTEDYVHDVFGNITKKTVTPYNTSPRIIRLNYDPSGRFLEESIDVEGQVTTYQYNINSGTLKSETNPQGLITKYEYDSWFRPEKVIDYLGKSITTEYSQSSSYEYTVKNTGDDGTGSVIIYDKLNRVKTKREKDVLGQWVKIDYQYDKFDRINNESEPYTGNAPTQWSETLYDFYSRPIKQNLYTGRTITMTYDALSVTVNDGIKTVTTTNDAIGNTKRVTDPGGTINYTYFGNGNLKTANYGGTIVTREQDGWGRKTKLIDPSAGTYSYRYNGFGELTQEKTPKGETNYDYSPIGKLNKKQIIGDEVDMTANYRYHSINKLLSSVTMTSADGNNSIYSYQYDNLHRLEEIKEQSPYALFSKNITYDEFGRVKSEKSFAKLLSNNKSTSKTILNRYQNGALESITDRNTGVLLWNISAINARGQATKTNMGNNLTEESTYTPLGYLQENKVVNNGSFIPEELMKLTTNFNAQRGTLNNRTNSLFSWSETFQYDNLDRLINFNDNDTDNEHTYDDLGRIKTNNVIGDYNYTGRAYQVDDITLNTQGDLYYQNNSLQQVSYNAVKKPVEIYEAGKEKVSFDYNAYMGRSNRFYGDAQDDKLLRNNRKHYSFDGTIEINYDKDSDRTEFIMYIGGDAYNAPAVWKSEQGGNTNTTQGYYYLYRDYLGSILMISDGDGNIKEKRHFDAWGNIVKVVDGNNSELNKLTFLDRGYTGHEHLQGVSLIHMNGRLYDPKLRRFLAPDNHIQDPYNSQSFNRYGYAWNNPLMYTDIDGEFLLESAFLIKLAVTLVTAYFIANAVNEAYFEGGSDSSNSSPPPPTQNDSVGSSNNSLANVEGYITHPSLDGRMNQPAGIFQMQNYSVQDNNLPILQGSEVINEETSNGNNIGGDNGFSITGADVADTISDFVPLVGSGKDIYKGFRDGNSWLVAAGVGGLILDIGTLGSASLLKGVVKTGIKAGIKAGAKGVTKSTIKKTSKYSTTAIGRMDDLKKYDDFPHIDTWRKSGFKNADGSLIKWKQNKQWLDDRIKRGDRFILATKRRKLPNRVGGYISGKPNGYYTAKELHHLTKQGINVLDDF